ncbi:hypothetical protein BKA56DRAFT_625806 [Ilyonectria sp. MPI-CAGE-AT-0026]|nr:hypothetical protein BKA56DRAFT_625806 [Ilyonectria sp. MPI-CAGE-AT-0026]
MGQLRAKVKARADEEYEDEAKQLTRAQEKMMRDIQKQEQENARKDRPLGLSQAEEEAVIDKIMKEITAQEVVNDEDDDNRLITPRNPHLKASWSSSDDDEDASFIVSVGRRITLPPGRKRRYQE